MQPMTGETTPVARLDRGIEAPQTGVSRRAQAVFYP